MRKANLGKKIKELRNNLGYTQQELSDRSGIDIRTIQRCEAGQVLPRQATLRILADALGCEPSVFLNNDEVKISKTRIGLLLSGLISGLFYFVIFILLSFPVFPGHGPSMMQLVWLGLGYLLFGVLFYNGFFIIGRVEKNLLMRISSLVIMLAIPVFIIAVLGNDFTPYAAFYHVMRITGIVFGLNGIIFGLALLRLEHGNQLVSKITGILQLIIAPLFVIPLGILNQAGNWLSVLFIPLLGVSMLLWIMNLRRA